jgi:hypothetical protein
MPNLNQMQTIKTLQNLLDELCSPDLTLGRAKVLRPHLFDVLGAMNSCDAGAGVGDVTRSEAGASRDAAVHQRVERGELHPEFTPFAELLQEPCVG